MPIYQVYFYLPKLSHWHLNISQFIQFQKWRNSWHRKPTQWTLPSLFPKERETQRIQTPPLVLTGWSTAKETAPVSWDKEHKFSSDCSSGKGWADHIPAASKSRSCSCWDPRKGQQLEPPHSLLREVCTSLRRILSKDFLNIWAFPSASSASYHKYYQALPK